MSSDSGAFADSRRNLVLMAFSSSLMLVLNVFIFVPFGIYQGNTKEFEVGFLQMLGGHWQPIILCWVLLMSPAALSGAVLKRYAVLVFTLACFTWLQSSLLMWDYGLVDGRGLNFQPYHLLGALDIFVLCALLVGVQLFSHRIAPMLNTVAWVFIGCQLGLMINSGLGRTEIWTRQLPDLEIPPALVSVSSEHNIFHLILDSAQSDVFLELIEEAGLGEEFTGFTLFAENAAVAPHTAFGVPSTFSGTLYDGSQSPENFFAAAVKNGFHSQLFEAGYSVNLVPVLSMAKGPHSNYFEVPSAYRGSGRELVQTNAARLMDIALFRIAPHFLRIAVYDDGNWFLSAMAAGHYDVRSFREKAFFRDYIDGLRIEQVQPAYHFIHLMPPHPPYVTLADGSYAGRVLPNTREHYLNEMRPMVELLVQLLERLDRLGVYDSTAIVIQGDHGSNVAPVVNGNPVKPCLSRLPALLAVKPMTDSNPLQVSHAPTSLLDVAATVLELAGLDAGSGSVFQLDSAVSRRRHYFMYKDNSISRYWIDGSVYSPDSCQKVDSLAIDTPTTVYEMGSRREFGVQGNAGSITDYGWGPQVEGHSWSRAKRAALQISIAESYLNTDLVLELHYRPYIDRLQLPRQRISVSVNDLRVDEWVAEAGRLQQRQIRIPARAVNRSDLNIVFEFPDAASPRSLGVGADRKKLGIALVAVRLSALGAVD